MAAVALADEDVEADAEADGDPRDQRATVATVTELRMVMATNHRLATHRKGQILVVVISHRNRLGTPVGN